MHGCDSNFTVMESIDGNIKKKKKKEFNFADLTCFSIIKICWIKSTDAMVLCDVKVCFIGKIKDHIIYKLALLIGKYFWCIMVVNELLIIY